MSKKNHHIKKYLEGKLPEPEVQADDAWAQMNDILGETSAPDPQLQNAGKFKYFLKYGLGFLAGISFVAIIWFWFPERQKIKTDVKPNFQEKLTDGIVLKDELEEIKTKVRENVITGKDRLVLNSTDIENKSLTGSLSNNKTNSKKLSNPKNQSINPGVADSKIHPFDTKTNTRSKNRPGNSQTAIVESENFKNKLNKKINKKIVSNTFPDSNKNSKSSGIINEKKSGDNTSKKSFEQVENQSSYFKEKNNSQENMDDIKSINKIVFSVKSLAPKSTRFPDHRKNPVIAIPVKTESKKEENKSAKSLKPFLKTFHVGLEWNAATSFKNTKYIFSGADSINRPYLLLIPGIWINKNLGKKQSVTASFFAYQPYFAGNKIIQQITTGDSTGSITKNTNMIKAVGVNLSLQYTYQFYSAWAISGGFGYSKLRSALFQETLLNYAGEIIPGSMATLKKPDLINFIQTNLVTFKTGIVFNPGQYQFGVNLTVPLTNVSVTSQPLRTLNGQIFFRFRLK